MTAPQPPSDRSSQHSAADPWEAPSASGAAPTESARPRESAVAGVRRRMELVEGAAAMVLLAAAGGVLLGVLWWWLAPRVPLLSNGEALFPANSEGEETIAADGVFVLLALALGLLAGVAVFLWRRRGGVLLVLALAAGATLAAVVAWRLGVWLDPSRAEVLQQTREEGAGATPDAPLQLNATIALLGLPFAAVAAHAVCTGLWGPLDRSRSAVPLAESTRQSTETAPASRTGPPQGTGSSPGSSSSAGPGTVD